MPAQLAVLSPDGIYLYITTGAVRDPEVRQWLIGRTDLEYCDNKGLARAIGLKRIEAIQHVAQTRSVISFEETLLTQAGEKRYYIRFLSPVLENDRVAYVLGYGLDITEQKHVEQALARIQARYRKLVEDASDIIYMADQTGHFTYANPSALNLLGYKREEIIGKHFATFIREDYRDEAIAFYLHQLEAVIPNTYFEFPVITSGGRSKWIGQNVQIVRQEGQVTGMQAVARDISPQKQAEEALRDSEALKGAILESALDSIITIDHEGRIVEFNPAAERTFGYRSEDILGKSMANHVIPSAQRPAHQRGLKHYLDTSEGPILGKRLELTALHANGHTFPVEASIHPIHLKDGRRLFTAYLRDITQRKKAEADLTRISQAVESSSDAIGMATPQGNSIYHNQAFLSLLGYTPEELNSLGGAANLFVNPKRVKDVKNALLRGKSWRGDVVLKNKSDELLQIALRVDVVRDQQDNPIALIGICTDITERKRAEEELRKAKALAEHSAKAKEQFLANMSHEMRTPLNAVLGMTHLLQETNPTETQRDYLHAIKFSSDHLLTLIDDLLDLAKINAGKIVFEAIPFQLTSLVKNLSESLRMKAEKKQLQMEIDLDARVPNMLVGDPVRLSQILLNLCDNAIKFTETGTVSLKATQTQQHQNRVDIRFEVEDTGIGISKENLRVIFDGFTQARNDTTRKYGGTGLGLTIVKELVERQGGRLQVESVLGRGSRFTIQLTFLVAEREPDVLEAPVLSPAPPLSLQQRRILLVEDNQFNQVVAASMLTKWGAVVEIAQNGKEAVERVRTKAYDLVLMDIQMPEMDGYEATRIIRKELHCSSQDLPILALTASVLTTHRERLEASGMDDFILKPFKPAVLLQRIAFHLGLDAPPPSEPSPSSSAIIDLSRLTNNMEGSQALTFRMVDLFLSHAPGQMDMLYDALKTQNWKQVKLTAHNMKASTGMLGIEALLTTLQDIEVAAQDQVGRIPVLIDQASEVLNQALHELRAQRDTYMETGTP